MMIRIFSVLSLFLFSLAQARASKRLIFIGNAGDPAVLNSIEAQALLDASATVIFIGAGGIGPDHPFLATIRDRKAGAIFVPGRHEWDNGKASGHQALRRRSEAFNKEGDKAVRFLPEKGCPGPETVELDKNVSMVVMDSQWWLQEEGRPEEESSCPQKTDMQLLDELGDIVSDNRDKLLLFVTYHPFKSTGLRSGYFGIRQHLFPLTDIRGLDKFYIPLPLVGSLYPVARSVLVSRQDMMHQQYQAMVNSMEAVLEGHPYLVRVAGHEQLQQLIYSGSKYHIVSGAGSGGSRAASSPETVFASDEKGFTVMEIGDDKEVNVKFYEVGDEGTSLAHTHHLFNFTELPPIAEDTAKLDVTGMSRYTAAVNRDYAAASGLKRWLNGNNYRREWATPVNLPVFRIKNEKGGFSIEGQGGGKQTTTIRLKDASGKEWSLRSINKDPEKVIPQNFRNSFARDIVYDMISASHPFAAAPVTSLSRALGIAAPEVSYYFIPNDTALGYYRPAFANTVAMLEERDPSLYGEKTGSTWKVFNDKLEERSAPVDQQSFLKARMLDILIADFDRHYEQFKWGERKSGESKTYYAVPKDRDQAFFNSDGLLIKLFAYNRMPFLKGFRPDIPSIHWYGFVARDIDGMFLNQLEKKDWEQTLGAMRAALTDTVISNAVRQLPPEIYAVDGVEITQKLAGRRNALPGAAMSYYQFLARHVNVTGSNNEETFRVSPGDSGGVKVEVYPAGMKEQPVYSRVFRPGETREVRLYGFNGADRFVFDDGTPAGIKFRIVGGGGEDVYDLRGNARKVVYDDAGERSSFLARNRTTDMISRRKDVNSYSFRENTFNSMRIPTLNVGYNVEDQFLVGLGFSVTRQGFRKEPFASQHRVSSLFALGNKAYQVRYDGEINHVFRYFDLLLNAALVNPHLNNFFGFGNETVKDPEKPLSYYRVRFSTLSGDVAVRRRFFGNKLGISLGPSLLYYWNNVDKNTDKILSGPEGGIDTSGVFRRKLYGGGRLSVRFNSIDNELLPGKGIEWATEVVALTNLNEAAMPYSSAQSNFALFAPLSSNRRFTFVLRAGGGKIFSEDFEYFQALTLGANNYLRGFRKNRFAGSRMAYASTELRMRVLRLHSKFLEGDLGLVGFNDLGRVWMNEESSAKLHQSQGGGIYFTPFNLVMLSALVAKSDEETLLNISVGARLNITF